MTWRGGAGGAGGRGRLLDRGDAGAPPGDPPAGRPPAPPRPILGDPVHAGGSRSRLERLARPGRPGAGPTCPRRAAATVEPRGPRRAGRGRATFRTFSLASTLSALALIDARQAGPSGAVDGPHPDPPGEARHASSSRPGPPGSWPTSGRRTSAWSGTPGPTTCCSWDHDRDGRGRHRLDVSARRSEEPDGERTLARPAPRSGIIDREGQRLPTSRPIPMAGSGPGGRPPAESPSCHWSGPTHGSRITDRPPRPPAAPRRRPLVPARRPRHATGVACTAGRPLDRPAPGPKPTRPRSQQGRGQGRSRAATKVEDAAGSAAKATGDAIKSSRASSSKTERRRASVQGRTSARRPATPSRAPARGSRRPAAPLEQAGATSSRRTPSPEVSRRGPLGSARPTAPRRTGRGPHSRRLDGRPRSGPAPDLRITLRQILISFRRESRCISRFGPTTICPTPRN